MTRYPCPYLNGEVELTVERERHIAERHPDLLPEHRDRVGETLAEPDQVRSSVLQSTAIDLQSTCSSDSRDHRRRAPGPCRLGEVLTA
jgi:hypothetical protein